MIYILLAAYLIIGYIIYCYMYISFRNEPIHRDGYKPVDVFPCVIAGLFWPILIGMIIFVSPVMLPEWISQYLIDKEDTEEFLKEIEEEELIKEEENKIRPHRF